MRPTLLLYLVLYLQDVLGYSALGTGVRLLVLSGGILATSTIAGRLSSHVPVRLLIGPGLVLASARRVEEALCHQAAPAVADAHENDVHAGASPRTN